MLNWVIGIDMYTLMCIKLMTNKNLLYKRKKKTITFFSPKKKKNNPGNSQVVQWLGLCTSTAGGTGSIPGRGAKIPHATWRGVKKKK